MRIPIDVLEVKSGVAKKSGRPYNIVLARVPAKTGNLGKLFSDREIPIQNDVEVEIEMTSNQELFLTPRIKEIFV